VSETDNKPVAIETRKDLLFRAPRRTSTRAIWIMAIAAFGLGVLMSSVLRDFVHIDHPAEQKEQSGSGPVNVDQVSSLKS